MHWKHVRHVPVEDDKGRLVGLISHRDLLEWLVSGTRDATKDVAVRDIMKTNLRTIAPDTPALEALRLMRENDIGCLPVIKEGKLVGLLTAHDFLTVSTRLFEERLREF
jgi:CBS domain-containing protein